MSERAELQCFNIKPHEAHDWTLLYVTPPTLARCPGLRAPERTEAERLVDQGEPWPSNGLPFDPRPRHGQGQ